MSNTGLVKPKTFYRTSDHAFAAYLKLAGVAFKGMVKEGTRVFFMFDEQEVLADLKLQYFNGEAKVAARPYAEEIRAFKTMIHA